MKSILIIPALNPPAELLTYIDELISSGVLHILLIDDGSSSDKTELFKTIEQHPECTVLRHSINMGKGRALKDAFSYVLNCKDWEGYDVITADSDGQHLVSDIIHLDKRMQELNRLRQGSLVLGCRNFRQEQVPFRSRFGNLLTCSLFHALYGVHISDTQTGLRGIPYCLLPRLCQLKGERFEYEMNMLTDAALSKTPIESIEITTVYLDNNAESHFNPIVDSLKIYKILLGTFFKYTCSSLISSIIDLLCFTIAVALLPLGHYQILEATIIARIISSLANYWFNRQLVFKENGNSSFSLLKYYILCVAVMFLSAGLVTFFSFLPVSPTLIKIVVDTILYLVNYQIQQRFIFNQASTTTLKLRRNHK